MTEGDKKDSQVSGFLDKLNKIPYSDNGWYYALYNFKISVITNYSDNHVKFESDIKRKLRIYKENQLRKIFQEKVMPYLENLSNQNRMEINKNKYNDNRNRKHRLLKKQKNGSS